MEEFVRCAALLASPTTDPGLRAQADAWLAAFRLEPAAWAAALSVLHGGGASGGPAAGSPEVRLQAASLLAWKVKKQLAQLQPVERQAELAEAVTSLLAAPQAGGGTGGDVAVRGLCLALANLAIQCSSWERPLETLGPRLSQEVMLEFLTLLPQECEDAAAAAQSASAELAWGLKARAHEWSPQVAAWLHALHTSSAAGGSPSSSPGGQAGTLAAVAAAAGSEALTLAVLRCFTSWVKWGCLQYVDARHAAYFASLAGELLFAGSPSAGGSSSAAATAPPFHPTLLPAAVDAASEVIEHAPEEIQPLLLQLAAALPARVAALRALRDGEAEAAAEELCHVFALFCSTHCAFSACEGPQGEALRQGLLQLLALPVEPDSDTGGAALPAMGALSDLLEHLVALQRGERTSEEEDGGAGGARPMRPESRRAFASSALDVLLLQLRPFPVAFQASAAAGAGPGGMGLEQGSHAPEGVPDALRKEAALVVDYIGDLLGADGLLARLAAHAESAAQHAGSTASSCLELQAALDVCLVLLEGMAGLLESCCGERAAGDPAPEWLAGVLRLYGLVAEADGPAGALLAAELAPAPPPAQQPPLTIFHSDFLSSFAAVGHLIMPLLQATQQQHLQLLQRMVLRLSLRALSDCPRTPDVGPGSTEDVVERAAAALRVLCSSATNSSVPTTPELLAGIRQGMALLQAPGWHQQYQDAHCQLVTGLVHALHGIPPGDGDQRAAAEGAVQQAIFAPLAAALAEVAAVAPGSPGLPPLAAAQQQRAALWRLHAALRQMQAMLNALESYAWYEGGTSGSEVEGQMTDNGEGQEVARGVASAAVAAVLASWPQLAQVCHGAPFALPPAGSSSSGAAAGGGTAAAAASLQREVHAEVAHCLSSCISLEPDPFRSVLPSFADTAAACFFLPGATALARPLIQAIDAYGPQPHYQQPLLGTVSAILRAPAACQLSRLRGGDADPETAQALLSLLGCCLRQACQWREVAPPAAAELESVLQLGLPLAVGNAACHHKDTSYQAVGTLSALLALLLDRSSPLHPGLLALAAQQGPALLEGLLLALLSLNSGSHLPKVVSLMSDVALLAATLALAQQQQQQALGLGSQGGQLSQEGICSAAGSQLAAWLPAVRASVVSGGVLTEEAAAALLAQWDWQPVLQQAALQLMQQQQGMQPRNSGGNGNGGPNAAELRRAMQRSARQFADLIRRSGSSSVPVAVA